MSNQIQINQKLMEREDRLAEIFELERQIHGILGGEPYPLAPPDGLPSRQKRMKPKRKAARNQAAPVRLRKLDPETEAAYRIVYRENQAEKSEIHTDARPLALLANTALPRFAIERIETVQATQDGGWERVEILYTS
ncbi:hypothetical protein PDESU_03255 [Pontiella desulfatans]|uniref:Uncharacterized protein n=1 Tax=Pontiella desulfatans TaxID=2750659 RepID=A0A6C2U4E2_PONDE|nr:hypothetical protein [Pontiella desulfatans]VGO14687.1 hypothetical protein PDESU_03255 [Pontiella desulfatans]